jgi:hypothetical protein
MKKLHNNEYEESVENDINKYKEEIKFFKREFVYVSWL